MRGREQLGKKCFEKLLRAVIIKNRLNNTAIRRKLITLEGPEKFQVLLEDFPKVLLQQPANSLTHSSWYTHTISSPLCILFFSLAGEEQSGSGRDKEEKWPAYTSVGKSRLSDL